MFVFPFKYFIASIRFTASLEKCFFFLLTKNKKGGLLLSIKPPFTQVNYYGVNGLFSFPF